MEEIKIVKKQDVKKVGHLLAQAFMHEEFWNWAIGSSQLNAEQQHKKLSYLFEVQAQHFSLPFQTAYLTEHEQGAALWTPPHQWHLNLFEQVKLLPHFLKILGVRRLYPVLDVINDIQKNHPTQPHYYLQTIGVVPQAQGRGVSSKLISPVLDQCDAMQVGAYLETATAQNVALYRHFGFDLINCWDKGTHGAPMVYSMWRDPC